MNRKLTLFAAALVALPLAAVAIAPRVSAGTSEPTEPVVNATATVGAPNVENSMQAMQNAQQKLGRAIDKKDQAAALTAVMDMQKAAAEAKQGTPTKAGELKEPPKKAEFIAGFRKQMIVLEHALLDIEAATIDNKLDEAKKILDERVKSVKKEGHGKFKGD